MLLATLAGCGKDNDGRIRILAEKMTPGGNAKVQIDPTSQTTIQNNTKWVAGEIINLDGAEYAITEDQVNNAYFIDGVTPTTDPMYAVYPGAVTGLGDFDVTNSSTSRGVVMRRLTVNFNSDGTHNIAFPMAGYATAGADKLNFKHITGGLVLTLQNGATASAKDIAYVRVVAQSESDNDAGFTINYGNQDFTARWEEQGPWVPSGQPGSSGSTVDVNYSSVMNLDFKSASGNYATLAANGGTLSFCVPVTISSVKRLVITGYAANGAELFNAKTPDFSSEVQIEANHMYPVKAIPIN